MQFRSAGRRARMGEVGQERLWEGLTFTDGFVKNPVLVIARSAIGVKSKMIKDNQMIIPEGRMERAILFIRGQKVMLDADLAWL